MAKYCYVRASSSPARNDDNDVHDSVDREVDVDVVGDLAGVVECVEEDEAKATALWQTSNSGEQIR